MKLCRYPTHLLVSQLVNVQLCQLMHSIPDLLPSCLSWLEAPLTSYLTEWFLPSPRHEIKVFARSRRNNISGENLRCCEATARCRDGSAPAATLVRWHRLLLNCRTWRPPPSPWQGMWAAWLSPAIAINPELPPGHCLARIHPGLPPGY